MTLASAIILTLLGIEVGKVSGTGALDSGRDYPQYSRLDDLPRDLPLK